MLAYSLDPKVTHAAARTADFKAGTQVSVVRSSSGYQQDGTNERDAACSRYLRGNDRSYADLDVLSDRLSAREGSAASPWRHTYRGLHYFRPGADLLWTPTSRIS